MKILVTGAGGLLGRALTGVASGGLRVTGLNREQMDVTDPDVVQRGVRRLQPELVIHAAAYTDVDGSERDPDRAMSVNAGGTENVARAAREVGAALVYISTDYVFDGARRAPYRETDRACPLSHYGRSKLEGEARARAHCPDSHLVVRSGWLYGTGKGFVDFALRRMSEPAPLRFVADQVGSPTLVSDLAAAILTACEKRLGGLYHYVNRGEVSWLDLARAVAELTGRSHLPIGALTMAELKRPAPRPPYSALAVEKFERAAGVGAASWRDALRRYLSTTLAKGGDELCES